MSAEDKQKIGYTRSEYLKSDELTLYHFRWNGKGTVIDPIEFEGTGRLPELSGMDEVVDALYGEEAKLLELSTLGSNKSD